MFSLTANLLEGAAVSLGLTVANLTDAEMFLPIVMPCLLGVRTPGDPANMIGMLSKEAGSVVPLSGANMWGRPESPLGMPFIIDVGLPNGHNNMELASIFDSLTGGGVFFCDIEGDLDNGIAPLQFTLQSEVEADLDNEISSLNSPSVTGFWIGNIPPTTVVESVALPWMAIGVHSDGDWHKAVDFYTFIHRPNWTFPDTPAWLREAGAIYAPAGGGAGGIYLSLPPAYLSQKEAAARGGLGRIASFSELPKLFQEGQALGTNILYLTDYWEGAGDGQPAYWNKGDYLPRADLRGTPALRDGIDAVRGQGGRVLLYLEPFTVYKNSSLGSQLGKVWGGQQIDSGLFWGLDLYDNVYPNYADSYEMVAPFSGWQELITDIAVGLIEGCHADGIFLDSYAWQMNRPMKVQAGPRIFLAQEYALGVLNLVKKLRAALQQVHPDAVVIGECTAGPIARYWDGGLNADLGFGNIWPCPGDPQGLYGVQRLTASPVRYGIPEVRMFGNGWTLQRSASIFRGRSWTRPVF
ncbi:MAG TPA: DUF6259 domain-containing protein [Bryobacteraceae bacterium]